MTTATSYVDSITGYYLENLPESLLAAFVSQEKITLTFDEMQAFASRMGISGAMRKPDTGALLASIASRMQTALDRVNGNAFIRLGSCSPKDSLFKPHPCGTVPDIFDMLFFSKRVLTDVHWAYLYDYPVSLFVRPWLVIQKWREFRCFVKNGHLYGISQYYVEGRPFYEEINNAPQTIAHDIYEFLKESVFPYAVHDTYTCDVMYEKNAIRIIDYNPFCSTTGLCFFASDFPKQASLEFRFWCGKGVGVVNL